MTSKTHEAFARSTPTDNPDDVALGKNLVKNGHDIRAVLRGMAQKLREDNRADDKVKHHATIDDARRLEDCALLLTTNERKK